MSNLNSILRSSTFAVVGIAGLTLSACASNSANARYGNVYDYESGQGCAPAVAPCAAAPVASTRYGDQAYIAPAPAPVYVQQQRTENVVYADCSVVQGMNCGPQVQQQMPVYQAQTQTTTQSYGGYAADSAPCPAGTTSNGDGTCMQASSSYSTSTYSEPATSYSTSTYSEPATSYSSSAETAPCPAGTTAAGDGTCMQSSASSYSSSTSYDPAPSYGSSSSYSSTSSSYGSSSSYGGDVAACPSGSTQQGDGTCAMNEGMSASNVGIEIYSEPVTTTTYGGYTNSGSYVGSTDYLPVRK